LLCTECFYHLPKTNFTDHKDNPVAELFWGRAKVENATSFFYYYKTGRYHNILHQLKYKGRKYIGLEMGRIFGNELTATPFMQADLVHAVPLHFKKLKKRGFNQSELIAAGISEKLNKPLLKDAIVKTGETPTQTKKTRYERWENVKGIYKVNKPDKIKNKHILLIDDVVTTGSTLEACANAVLEVEGTKVSIATLGFTRMNY
jgi:ComF family protein